MMILDVNDYPPLAILRVSLALILGEGEIGHWVGERAARRGAPGVSTLEGAILGLLALMIGLAPLSSQAGWLLLPYLLWVTFAAFLNLTIVRLNAPFGTARSAAGQAFAAPST